MNENNTQSVATIDKPETAVGFETSGAFEHIQRVAKMFSSSELVPQTFRGAAGLANAVIALDMAKRMNASPLAVMQQIYIVHGKPSWSSQFIIACINSCGRYSPLRFKIDGTGDAKSCIAWAIEHATGEKLEGPPVSIDMAKKEGWYGKNGSKWQTMPDLMLRYRAATLFGRLYAPELLMGMQAMEEVIDVEVETKRANPFDELKKPEFGPEKQIEAPTVTEPLPDNSKNYLKGVRDLINLAKVKEADVLEYLRTAGKIDESLSSLEEINMVNLPALQWTFDNWQEVERAIKKTKGAAK